MRRALELGSLGFGFSSHVGNDLMSSDDSRSSRATKIPRIATAIVFVLALGYLFHTSHEPILLGKYNLRYTIFLGVVFFVLIPMFYFVARFFAATHELRGSGGRRIPIRPLHKVKAASVLALIGCVAIPVAFSAVN